MNNINEFAKEAQRLAKNPLGIIALFIVLVYGFAVLLLGASGDKLNEQQKWVMVWFIIGFPIIVLFTFYRLVTKHHAKLYAPSDYPDPKDFLHSLPADQQRSRIEAKPEIKKEEDSTKEIAEKIPHKAEIEKPISKSEYLIAEDLAFRKLKIEFKEYIMRNVSLKNRVDIMFDGSVTRDNILYLIEVKYTNKPDIKYHIIDALKNRVRTAYLTIAKNNPHITVRLLLVVVADLNEDDMYKLESYLHDVTENSMIEFRIFDLNELKKEFRKGNDS